MVVVVGRDGKSQAQPVSQIQERKAGLGRLRQQTNTHHSHVGVPAMPNTLCLCLNFDFDTKLKCVDLTHHPQQAWIKPG